MPKVSKKNPFCGNSKILKEIHLIIKKMNTKKIITLPYFIKNNETLQSIKIEKIFPLIGLDNCSSPVKKQKVSIDVIKSKIDEISCFVQEVLNEVDCYYGNKGIKFSTEWFDILDFSKKNLKKNKQGKIILTKLFKDPTFNRPLFPKGSDCLSILNAILNKAVKLEKENDAMNNAVPELDSLNALICPTKKHKIHFSSAGTKGLWDIATMSMRGVISCMNWDSDHAQSLVGSIIDPYCGIIYLTDGSKTEYGEKMIARAVVRLIANHKHTPEIFIEKIYFAKPDNENDYINNDEVLEPYYEKLFSKFIKNKVGKKYKIITDTEYGEARISNNKNYYIPLSKNVILLAKNSGVDVKDIPFLSRGDESLSYRDSGIPYKEAPENFKFKF